MHLMHKLMGSPLRANLHIHVPHYTHFIPFMSKNDQSKYKLKGCCDFGNWLDGKNVLLCSIYWNKGKTSTGYSIRIMSSSTKRLMEACCKGNAKFGDCRPSGAIVRGGWKVNLVAILDWKCHFCPHFGALYLPNACLVYLPIAIIHASVQWLSNEIKRVALDWNTAGQFDCKCMHSFHVLWLQKPGCGRRLTHSFGWRNTSLKLNLCMLIDRPITSNAMAPITPKNA